MAALQNAAHSTSVSRTRDSGSNACFSTFGRNNPGGEANAELSRASQHDARGRLSGEPREPRVMSTNVGMASRRDGQTDWRLGDEPADGNSFEVGSDDDEPYETTHRHGVGVAGDLSGEDDDEYDEEAGFSGRGHDDYGASLSNHLFGCPSDAALARPSPRRSCPPPEPPRFSRPPARGFARCNTPLTSPLVSPATPRPFHQAYLRRRSRCSAAVGATAPRSPPPARARPPVPTNLAAGRADGGFPVGAAADPRPNARARRRPARHFAAAPSVACTSPPVSSSSSNSRACTSG